ncbi:hypothetical protein JG687_00017299 [Phytophthora cactorum]|uniref:Uncharacterized protein n=1 Tax=Phytophthora cactorum TaxID=29920 RepID=A0A8T1TTK5_9STRA|nr:hypothetical protein JG687_00017299 [Phytophthora cactorum]
MVRKPSLKHRKQVYVAVYNVAASAFDGIESKSSALLLGRWEGVRIRTRKSIVRTQSETLPAPMVEDVADSSESSVTTAEPVGKKSAKPALNYSRSAAITSAESVAKTLS